MIEGLILAVIFCGIAGILSLIGLLLFGDLKIAPKEKSNGI